MYSKNARNNGISKILFFYIYNRFSFMKNYLNITLIMSVVIASAFCFEVGSQTFNFGPVNFSVVNNTINSGTPSLGSFFYIDTIIAGVPTKYYQLTDTFIYQGISMRNLKQIDLKKGFVFDFKLFFGTGKTTQTVDPADGICFILTTVGGVWNTPLNADLGFGEIPSFGIEYDTESSDDPNSTPEQHYEYEGGPPLLQHTAYIKNAKVKALPGTFSQMQNNWGKVTTGQWYKCRIVWKRSGSGYVMENWIEERGEPTDLDFGELVLRNSMFFATVGDLIDGLEPDSNCRALAWWGIGAGTCFYPNLQMIQFDSLIVEPNVVRPDPIIILFGYRLGSFGTWVHYVDTLYASYDDCTNQPVFPTDTLYRKDDNGIEKCNFTFGSNNLYFSLNMTDLDSAKWFINDSLVQTGTEKDSICYSFHIWEYQDIYDFRINYTDEHIIVKVELNDSTEIVFKIKVFDHNYIVSNFTTHWAALLDLEVVEITGNTATISVDLTNGFTIPMPPALSDCELTIKMDDIEFDLDVDNNIILPQIEDCEISEINARFQYRCECYGTLNIVIKNTAPECEENCDCDDITIIDNWNDGDPVFDFDPWGFGFPELPEKIDTIIVGDFIIIPDLPTYIYATDINIINESDCELAGVNVLNFFNPDELPPSHFTFLDEGIVRFIFRTDYHPNQGGVGESGELIPYAMTQVIMCVEFENGDTCCHYVPLTIIGNWIESWNVFPNPVEGGIINVEYELFEIRPVPLQIAIYDQLGLKKIDVMNSVSTQLSNILHQDITSLDEGIHYLVLQMGSQIEVIQFIKQ